MHNQALSISSVQSVSQLRVSCYSAAHKTALSCPKYISDQVAHHLLLKIDCMEGERTAFVFQSLNKEQWPTPSYMRAFTAKHKPSPDLAMLFSLSSLYLPMHIEPSYLKWTSLECDIRN